MIFKTGGNCHLVNTVFMELTLNFAQIKVHV